MGKFYASICKTEMHIAKYALGLLALLVFVAAVARTVHHPMNWAVDAATFLFAWTVFLGADAALRLDRLFCIEIITNKFSKTVQTYVKLINYTIILVFLLGMIGYGSYLSYTTRLRTFQGIPGFSYTWVTISVPIGCLLMLATTIRKIRDLFAAKSAPVPAKQDEQQITEVI